MRIHLLSDLHAEFRPFKPTHPGKVSADVIVLAGDIIAQGRAVEWALDTFKDFNCPVIFVAGNHDYYNTEIQASQERFKNAAAQSNGRLHYLEQESVVLDGVRFVGTTGWTDFQYGGNAPLAKLDAARNINDYHKIRCGREYRHLGPDDTEQFAVLSRAWLASELAKSFEGETVLVTHHPITDRSRDATRSPRLLDAAYYNSWEHLLNFPLKVVLHGHTHHAVDYWLGETRVVSNPLGYPGESTGFNPELIIEI